MLHWGIVVLLCAKSFIIGMIAAVCVFKLDDPGPPIPPTP